jgi:hypothetical protein
MDGQEKHVEQVPQPISVSPLGDDAIKQNNIPDPGRGSDCSYWLQ